MVREHGARPELVAWQARPKAHHMAVIALMGGGLALINISIDQVSNPKLRTGLYLKIWRRMKADVDAKRGLS